MRLVTFLIFFGHSCDVLTPKIYQLEDLLISSHSAHALTTDTQVYLITSLVATRLSLVHFPLQPSDISTAITFGFTFYVTEHALLEEDREVLNVILF